jgi:hypothetical protein
MKTRSSYVMNSLIMQMFVVPMLLTAMFIWVFPLSDKILIGFGKDAKTLVYATIVIIGSLIVGGITALLFLKLSKNKLYYDKVIFYTPIIPIVYALLFAVFVTLITGNDYDSQYWSIYVFKNPFFLILMVFYPLQERCI